MQDAGTSIPQVWSAQPALFTHVVSISAALDQDRIHRIRFLYSSMSLQEKFDAAVRGVQNLPKEGPYQPSNDLKLKLYSLYKQATEGPCRTSKPAFYDLIGRAKWNAWKKLEGTGREEAMSGYVAEIKNMLKLMSENNRNSDEYTKGVGGPFHKFLALHGEEFGEDFVKEVDAVHTGSGLETNFLEQNLTSYEAPLH